MDDPAPALRYEHAILATGALNRGSRSVSVATLTIYQRTYDFEVPWEFVAHIEASHRDNCRALLHPADEELAFEGTTNDGRHIRASKLYWTQFDSGRLLGEVREVTLSRGVMQGMPATQGVDISLTPTSLAVPEHEMLVRSHTGEMRTWEENRPRALHAVSTPRGVGHLVQRFSWESASVGDARCNVAIPRPCIELRLMDENRSANAPGLAQEMLAWLERPLRLISFLSRRHVHAVHLSIASRSSPPEFAELDIWRPGAFHARGTKLPRLMNPHRAPPDAFDTMIRAYTELPHAEAVDASTIYLVETAGAEYAETQVVSAFTAFEALLTALSRPAKADLILPASQFKRLSSALRDRLPELVRELGREATDADAIAAKLPELNRRPLLEKALTILEGRNVPWEDLWRRHTPLKDGLRAAIGRRNLFIHTGELASPWQAWVDAMRIHALTERLLYGLVHGDDEWQDWQSYRHVEVLRRLDVNGDQ